MENSITSNFNNTYCVRTRAYALSVYKFTETVNKTESSRHILDQLRRCTSSVAANFRAVTRARSLAEYYSKICIVVEECDESQFWLDFLGGLEVVKQEKIKPLLTESEELLKIFSKTKRKLKERLKSQ
jgi:four helix bundle protein